jgi:hypothetical protein
MIVVIYPIFPVNASLKVIGASIIMERPCEVIRIKKQDSVEPYETILA